MTSELHEAALAFRRALRNATERELETAERTFGRWASDSVYASTHEPDSGVCVAINAELRQRAYNYQHHKLTASECDAARRDIWAECNETHQFKQWRNGAVICDRCFDKVSDLERRYEAGLDSSDQVL